MHPTCQMVLAITVFRRLRLLQRIKIPIGFIACSVCPWCWPWAARASARSLPVQPECPFTCKRWRGRCASHRPGRMCHVYQLYQLSWSSYVECWWFNTFNATMSSTMFYSIYSSPFHRPALLCKAPATWWPAPRSLAKSVAEYCLKLQEWFCMIR